MADGDAEDEKTREEFFQIISGQTDRLQRLILGQLHRTVIPTSLHLEECNTWAHGLENRLPYLVPSVVRMARAMPADFLVSNEGATKSILRHALRGMLPSAILDRRDRVGFAVPALPWLQELGPWTQKRLDELHLLPFYQGRSKRADLHAASDAFQIWRWIALLEWAKAHNVTFR